jgi:hypothetical protein
MTQTVFLRPFRKARSRFKGVSFHQGRWRAAIYIESRSTNLGVFDTEEQAAWAYDKAALLHFGAEAYLNFRDAGKRIEICPEEKLARIGTSTGEAFLVDIEDAESVSKHYWRPNKTIISTRIDGVDIALHEFLLGKMQKPNTFVNLNGDRLDYRRSNLAIVPRCLQAGRHRKVLRGGSSRFKGVSRMARARQYWQATISSKGKRYILGQFHCEEEAALAYDKAARQFFGRYAAVNFPGEGEVGCLAA